MRLSRPGIRNSTVVFFRLSYQSRGECRRVRLFAPLGFRSVVCFSGSVSVQVLSPGVKVAVLAASGIDNIPFRSLL